MKKFIGLIILVALGYWAWTSPVAGRFLYQQASDLEAQWYGFEQQNIPIEGMSLATYVGGDPSKPAIVMLHGFSADKDVWPRFAKHFVEDYFVLIPDLAGHGDTEFRSGWDYSGPAQAKRVAQLLDHLGVEKAHLIGNSMGGFITAWFARLYPQRSLSATPVDPGGMDSPVPSGMEKMIAEGRNPFFVSSRAEFDQFYAMTMAQPPFLPESVLAYMSEEYQARRESLIEIKNGFYKHNWLTHELQHINVPTLIIWGSEDEILHPTAAEVWHQQLPNSKLVMMENYGHMPMTEAPAKTASIYKKFLSRLN